jgi:hypothetical protein
MLHGFLKYLQKTANVIDYITLSKVVELELRVDVECRSFFGLCGKMRPASPIMSGKRVAMFITM